MSPKGEPPLHRRTTGRQGFRSRKTGGPNGPRPSSRAYRSRHPVLHRVVLSAAGGLFRPGGRRAGTPTE